MRQGTISRTSSDNGQLEEQDRDVTVQDYRELVSNSSARIACFDFLIPVSFVEDPEELVTKIFSSPSECREVNPAFAQALGASPARLGGRSISEVLPISKGWDELFRKWSQNGLHKEGFDVKIFTPSGRIEILQSVIYARRDRAEFDRIWIVCRNISDHVNTLQALKLSEQHAQRLDTLGALTTGIAHDFNNHLTAVLGELTLGLDKLDSEHESRHHFNAARKAALSCAEVTKQLLGLGRRSAGERRPIDMHRLMNEVVELLRRVLPSKIEVATVMEHDLGCVEGDPTQLQQVFMNLAINARDAMEQGGRLLIKSRRLAGAKNDGPDHLEISVADSGVGIPEELVSKIFEPFFTTKSPDRGTGLGLSMSNSIIQAHNGDLSVRSYPGQGTTFKIRLPTMTNISDSSSKQPVIERKDIKNGSGVVLVADDDDMVRDMLVSALTIRGYTVLSASNGEEAFALFAKNASTISAVVLDDTMPKSLGRDAAKRMLNMNSGVRLVLTSGNGGTVQDYVPGNSKIVFLPKPYGLEDIFASIR